jgi:hypothetical protein
VLAAFTGMIVGSLAPQAIRNQKTDVQAFVADTAPAASGAAVAGR